VNSGPVARLFGSLANALLDLGLPTIRDWLRDRLGPAADVAHVTTDGSLVHLDGVRIPIGPRGLLSLDRASASIVGLGAGLPEIRFHAGSGALVFGDGASPTFRADVSFMAAPDPDENAWIWGELEISGASWSSREGGPPFTPMHGRARLFVSSHEWRLEAGRLEGEIVRAHFVGAGVFEAGGDEGSQAAAESGRAVLVPRSLSAAALTLEHARVGPFVDAAGALVGRQIAIPPFVPLDAQLDGNLAWSFTEGGTADLRVASASIQATVRGSISPDGRKVAGQVAADVAPAAILRDVGGPREAMPRDDDVLRVELEVGGSLRQPAVNGKLRARELGFRLGRPRFVPPIIVRGVEAEIFVKDDRAVVSATLLPSGTTMSELAWQGAGAKRAETRMMLDLDANLRDPSSARGTLRTPRVDPAFLRDIVRTLDAKVVIADDVSGAIDLAFAPTEAGRVISGTITVATPSSNVVLAPLPSNPATLRLTGTLAPHDLIAAGLFRGSVRPVGGEIVLDVEVDGSSLSGRGTVEAKRIAIVLTHRPELAPWPIEDATANLTVDRSALAYDALRFRALGGRFLAHGVVPFVREASRQQNSNQPRISLRLEDGGLELAIAILDLVRAPPPEPMHLPIDVSLRGVLDFSDRTRAGEDAPNLVTDVTIETPRGSALDLGVRLSGTGGLDGSTVRGAIAVSDLVAANVLPPARIAGEGTLSIDAVVQGRGETLVALGGASADRVVVRTAPASDDGPSTLVVTLPITSLRIDRRGAMWKDLDARIAGGRVTSTGLVDWSGRSSARVSLSSVAIHELPAVSSEPDGAGRLPSTFVRGDLFGSIIVATEEGRAPRVAGSFTLDGATFPAIDRLRPALARYGLRPPNEDAIAPAKTFVASSDWGISFRDIAIDLHGATVRGEVGISHERTLDGRLEVTLEEEYLRTSKMLTLPRVLTERLVVPIDIEGPVDDPDVQADIGTFLGRFIKESHVAQLFTSSKRRDAKSRRRETIPPFADELAANLDAAIGAHEADWQAIAPLRARLRGGG
jgi:hypothetical protein